MISRTIVFTTIALVVLWLNQSFALDCPKFPEQAKKDWEVKVGAEVAKIGALRGAELKVTTGNVTRDLFASLPDAGRVYLEQMMMAAYCSTLRDDRTITETEKSKRLKEYIGEVREAITTKQKNESQAQYNEIIRQFKLLSRASQTQNNELMK
jgi:hypothetical protein